MAEESKGRGRTLGWRKPEGVRTMHSIKAYPDEWLLIKKFAHELKKGDRKKCEDFLRGMEKT